MIHVLGAVRLDDPRKDQILGQGKARELLALLVAHRSRPASTTEIIEALWSDADSPATARTIVHGLIRRIRQAVGADAVVRDAAGYGLALPNEDVDLWVVDSMIAAGSLHAARERWTEPIFGRYSDREWARDVFEATSALLWPTRHQLGLLRSRSRAPASRLVGRRRELAVIERAAQRSRLVTIVGLGGVGKTRLAVDAIGRIGGEVIHVDVGAAVGPAASRLAAELGMAPGASAESDLRAAVSLIGHRRYVLLLDGCEHDLSGMAAIIGHLLAGCRRLFILATSRTALGVPGEHVVPLLPFDEPDAPRGDAVNLLLDRAYAMGMTEMPTDRERASDICRRSAGVPLAIELGVSELILGSDGQRSRDRPGETVLTPEMAVAVVVNDALDGLSAPARDAARRASLLVSGLTPEFFDRLQPKDVSAVSVMHELVSEGLVASEIVGRARRLRFPDRVRHELLSTATEEDESTVRSRLVEHLEAARPEMTQPPSIRHLVLAVSELPNVHGMLERLSIAGRAADRLELASAAAFTWAEHGMWSAGVKEVSEALAAAEPSEMEWARAVFANATVVGTFDGLRRLIPELTKAADIARSEGAVELEVRLRIHLANAFGYADRLPEAREQAQRAHDAADELGSEYAQIGAASIDSAGLLLTNDLEAARRELGTLGRRLEDLGALSDAARLHRLSSIACRAQADAGGALDALATAERLAFNAHARGTLATIRGDIADLRFTEHPSMAAPALEDALDTALAVGNLRAAGILRTRLGAIHEDVATLARGALDLWFTDGRRAAVALASLLDRLPASHRLRTIAPQVIVELADGWGTPLDADGLAVVESCLATAPDRPLPPDWDREIVSQLEDLTSSV